MIGRTFGRYRIVAPLAIGELSGSLWRADDTLLGRSVAVRLLPGWFTPLSEASTPYDCGSLIARRLDHPSISKWLDAGEQDGQIFVVSEFIEGESLDRTLDSGPLPLPALLRLGIGVSEALSHAHERMWCLGALSAGDVVVRPDGAPVIIEFGLAQLLSDSLSISTGVTSGTPLSFAPERWRGEPVGPLTDLWSLGVLLYRAATGTQPFGAQSVEAIAHRVLHDVPAKPTTLRPDLPAEFERLLLRLLEQLPNDRPPSAAAVAGEFRRIADTMGTEPVARSGVPTDAEPTHLLREHPLAVLRRSWRRLTRRRFGPVHVAGLAALLLAAGVGTFLLIRMIVPRAELVLAVIPFRDASADREDTGYIAEALGGELALRLGRMGGFRVLPWETTVRVRDSQQGWPDVARALRADLLLLGRFDVTGGLVHVSVELVDGRGGLQRWSARVEGDARDLQGMQAEIAERIARRVAVPGRRRVATSVSPPADQNPEAYEAFLRGANALHATSIADRMLAEPLFRRALELDSTLTQAWLGRGAVLVDQYFQGEGGTIASLIESRLCFERALALDPGSGPAVRGLVRALNELDVMGEAALAVADSLGPGVSDELERHLVRGWACLFFLPGDALDAFDRAIALDPMNRGARWSRPISLWWSGRLEEAVKACKNYLKDFGEDAIVYAVCGNTLSSLGRYEEAQPFLNRAVEMDPGGGPAFVVLYAASVLRASGRSDAAAKLLEERLPQYEAALAASPDNLRLRADVANLHAARGDMERFDAQWSVLTRAVAARAPGAGMDLVYTPYVLAQVGELDRAKRVLDFNRGGSLNLGLLSPPTVGAQIMFRGSRSAELATSAEMARMREAVLHGRAALRARHPFLAGSKAGIAR